MRRSGQEQAVDEAAGAVPREEGPRDGAELEPLVVSVVRVHRGRTVSLPRVTMGVLRAWGVRPVRG